jgi:ribonuclease HI
MKQIDIYTDGSSLGNPGPGGWAAVILDVGVDGQNGQKVRTFLQGGEANVTNNQMEMMAVIAALEWIQENGPKKAQVKLHSDSKLVVNTINDGWKRKANVGLWRKLDKARKDLDVEWIWVKGHADNEWNNTVDELAVSEAEKIAQEVASARGANGPSELKAQKSGGNFCGKCNKHVKGVLGWMPDSKMIRCECGECGAYIMFAEKSEANMARAKKRVLISKKQLAHVVTVKEEKGEVVTEPMLKKLKTWTGEEAGAFLEQNQKLF